MSEKRTYDSTVARIAGNVAGHLLDARDVGPPGNSDEIIRIAKVAVLLARAIVGETERTEPHD